MHFMPSPREGNLSTVVIHGVGALGKDHAVVAVVLVQWHENCQATPGADNSRRG